MCGHTSSNHNYFSRHLLKHAQQPNSSSATGVDNFQCIDCNKTFQRRMHYERHRRDVHGPGLRPHLCDICGKAFKRTDALQQHKVVHLSQASRTYHFHCHKCDKGFRSHVNIFVNPFSPVFQFLQKYPLIFSLCLPFSFH